MTLIRTGIATVWSGRPGGGIRFERDDIFFVPFALLWTALVFLFGIPILRAGFQFQDVILVFMMLLGVYVTVGRFLVDMFFRSMTTYLLTSDSAIIRGPFGSNAAVHLPGVTNLTMSAARDGTGSIYFGAARSHSGWQRKHRKNTPAFRYIDRVADVFELCKRVQRGELS